MKQSPIAFPSHVILAEELEVLAEVELEVGLFGFEVSIVAELEDDADLLGEEVLLLEAVVVRRGVAVLGLVVGLLVGLIGLLVGMDGLFVDIVGFLVDKRGPEEVFESDVVDPSLDDESPLDGGLDPLDEVLVTLQWYFRMDGSPVFIRMHFLPDALHDLKQLAISFPSQVDFVTDDEELGCVDPVELADDVGFVLGLFGAVLVVVVVFVGPVMLSVQ